MTSSVELQVISKILTTDSSIELDRLCAYDESYYAVFKEHIRFILEHKQQYGDVPDVFTFQAKFEDIVLVQVNEPIQFLEDGLRKNKQQILLLETFNKLSDLGSADVSEAWEYLSNQVDRASELDTSQPLNIVKDADKRAQQILEFNKQKRIPTGFKQIDKCLYGGLSTVEELLVIIARTNSGKAQPLWSKVLTPHGWKTMGEVQIGDTLIGKNNDNGKVIQIFPQGVKDYYRVHFDDGTYAECCDDHLWEVVDIDKRINRISDEYEVLKLSDIRKSDTTYTVDLCGQLEFDATILFPNEVEYGQASGYFVTTENVIDSNRSYKIITRIEYVGKTECQCILLDNESHTYITDGYTVTHNSWVCTKMMESAQANGFPVLFYSPEMQSCFIGARFDTWRSHFKNSDLFRGNYTEEYLNYLKDLAQNSTDAFVVEDKDMSEGKTTVSGLERLVKKHHIKLLIVDGLSYIAEEKRAANDSIKYKDICNGLFRLSKTYGCAVVVAMQANRDTKETKDEKGLPFPTMYEAESSDHPARIATQVFTMRQIFEKHIMDIRLEKSRTAANTRPVFSYSWDPNTGNMEYVENVEESANTPVPTSTSVPTVSSTISIGNTSNTIDGFDSLDDDDDDDIEF
jgi:replicative DNA helicase